MAIFKLFNSEQIDSMYTNLLRTNKELYKALEKLNQKTENMHIRWVVDIISHPWCNLKSNEYCLYFQDNTPGFSVNETNETNEIWEMYSSYSFPFYSAKELMKDLTVIPNILKYVY